MPTKDLRGKIAIVGACETDKLGTLPTHSMITLHAEGIRNALDDAGLRLSDVDGLLCPGIPDDLARRVPGDHAAPLQQHPDGRLLLHRHGRARHAGPRRGHHQRRRHLPRRKRPLPRRRRPVRRRAQPPQRPIRGPLRHLRRAHDVLPAGHTPHARVRHHAGATGGSVGLDPEVGPDAPQGRHEGRPHRRRRSELPHGLLALHPVHVLSGHRRRRRARAHPGRRGRRRSPSRRSTCSELGTRRRTTASRVFATRRRRTRR